MKPLLVSEVFGPTIQGEGPDAGRIAHFVRLGLCNLDCAWCDTPYTWDFSGKLGLPVSRDSFEHVDPLQLASDLVRRTRAHHVIVITGGEPLVQQRTLSVLCELLAPHRELHVETNGTLAPIDELPAHITRWVVSPKVATTAQVHPERAIDDKVIERFVQLGASFKFVISHEFDVAAVDRLVSRCSIPARDVWLMPEGRDAATLVERHRWLGDVAVRFGFNMCSRLHVLAWGDKRGV